MMIWYEKQEVRIREERQKGRIVRREENKCQIYIVEASEQTTSDCKLGDFVKDFSHKRRWRRREEDRDGGLRVDLE